MISDSLIKGARFSAVLFVVLLIVKIESNKVETINIDINQNLKFFHSLKFPTIHLIFEVNYKLIRKTNSRGTEKEVIEKWLPFLID